MPSSQIRSPLFAASRRLSRSPLKHTRGISCVRGRFYQNQFFSELMARGWVSSFSLTTWTTDRYGRPPPGCRISSISRRMVPIRIRHRDTFSFLLCIALSWYRMWIIHENGKPDTALALRIRLFISGALVYMPDWIPGNKIRLRLKRAI